MNARRLWCVFASSILVCHALATSLAAESPAFTPRLTDAEYADQSAKVLQAFGDREAQARSPIPSVGAKIVTVVENLAAAEAGLSPGDFVVRSGGRRMWSYWIPSNRDEYEVEVVRVASAPAGESQTLQLGNQFFGAYMETHWRPELEYLRTGQRSPRWDDHALVGLLSRGTSPALCETAWAKALSAGYQADIASHVCGTLVCLNTGRYDDAAKFMSAAEESVDFSELADSPWLQPALGARTALATDRFRDVVELVRRNPTGFDFSPQMFLAYIERLKYDAGGSRPLDLDDFKSTEERFLLDDLKPRLVGMTRRGVMEWMPLLRRHDALGLETPTATYKPFQFSVIDPLRDVRFACEFTAEATDDKESRWRKAVEVGIARREEQPNFGLRDWDLLERIATVEVDVKSRVSPVLGGFNVSMFTFEDPSIVLDGKTTQKVQITRIGRYVEILVNDKRVLRGPVDDASAIVFFVRVCGTKAKFSKFQTYELVERPTPE